MHIWYRYCMITEISCPVSIEKLIDIEIDCTRRGWVKCWCQILDLATHQWSQNFPRWHGHFLSQPARVLGPQWWLDYTRCVQQLGSRASVPCPEMVLGGKYEKRGHTEWFSRVPGAWISTMQYLSWISYDQLHSVVLGCTCWKPGCPIWGSFASRVRQKQPISSFSLWGDQWRGSHFAAYDFSLVYVQYAWYILIFNTI